MKTIVVTGASGFVGRHVIPALLKNNYQIHAIYLNKTPAIYLQDIIWHQLDLHVGGQVEMLMQVIKPTHLLHLAWYAKPGEYWTSLLNHTWVQSSINLLNAFINAGGRRAVFTGSCAEYDWKYSHCHEFLTPCNPQTLYGTAKNTLQILTGEIAKSANVSLAWARLFYLFGEHENKERLIPAAICTLLNKKKFIVQNSLQVRDFMHVQDVGDALVALLNSIVNGPVNIAGGKPISIQALIGEIAKKTGTDELVEYKNPQDNINTLLTADIDRLKKEVNWKPHLSIQTALDQTISWWQGQL